MEPLVNKPGSTSLRAKRLDLSLGGENTAIGSTLDPMKWPWRIVRFLLAQKRNMVSPTSTEHSMPATNAEDSGSREEIQWLPNQPWIEYPGQVKRGHND